MKRPIVISVPRSGFTLLIGVINEILKQTGSMPQLSGQDKLINRFVEFSGSYLTHEFKRVAEEHNLLDDFIYNGEFHLLVGGPKWLDKTNPSNAAIRKYFGVRGLGDFLLILYFPREVLNYYPVIHSHVNPTLWSSQEDYSEHTKLTSIRNPLGIINSASFSINAMTSEYIQRFAPNLSEDFVRQRMGLYKLTNLDVFEGLTVFLRRYLDNYLAAKDKYHIMRWEDLIQNPGETIKKVAEVLGVDISLQHALNIWTPMDHVNTLQFHKHNYRRGKGIVGDWKNSLINEHLDLFRQYGMEKYIEELGYPPIADIDPTDYSPYQKLIEAYLKHGEVYPHHGDPNIFTFSFNKSNIDPAKFGFASYDRRAYSHIERTTMKDNMFAELISDKAEMVVGEINEILREILSADLDSSVAYNRAFHQISKKTRMMADSTNSPTLSLLQQQLFEQLPAVKEVK